jgi:hypothetical protein
MEVVFGCVERHPKLLRQFRLLEQLGAIAGRDGNDDKRHQREEAGDENERRDPEVQREGNDVKYPSFQSPFAHPVTRSRARTENIRLTAGLGTCPISTRMKRWHAGSSYMASFGNSPPTD